MGAFRRKRALCRTVDTEEGRQDFPDGLSCCYQKNPLPLKYHLAPFFTMPTITVSASALGPIPLRRVMDTSA